MWSHFMVTASHIWISLSRSPLARNFPLEETARLWTIDRCPFTELGDFLSILFKQATFFISIRDHLTIEQSFEAEYNAWQSGETTTHVMGSLWSLQDKCLILVGSGLSYKSATVRRNLPVCSSKSSFKRWAITDLSISASSVLSLSVKN